MSDKASGVPPHSVEMEEALIGSMLLSSSAVDAAQRHVRASDFYVPQLAELYDVIVRMHDAGHSTNPAVIADELQRLDRLVTIGGHKRLQLLQANTPASATASYYAKRIAEDAARRGLIALGGQITELGADESLTLDDALTRVDESIARLQVPGESTKESSTMREFLDTPEPDYDWLVRGLLERRERVIIVGGEGGGKSTLMRQMAVQLSQGIHPFKNILIDPLHVMLLDFENRERRVRRALRSMDVQARAIVGGGRYDASRLHVLCRENGIDVTDSVHKRWLIEQISYVRPDVVAIGPLYMLHREDMNEETAARAVADTLGLICKTFGCAMLIETHAPHGGERGRARKLRPVGSSLWMRWPDYGLAITPTASPIEFALERFRGDRDEREWPFKLQRGGRWPWSLPTIAEQSAMYDSTTVRDPLDDSD